MTNPPPPYRPSSSFSLDYITFVDSRGSLCHMAIRLNNNALHPNTSKPAADGTSLVRSVALDLLINYRSLRPQLSCPREEHLRKRHTNGVTVVDFIASSACSSISPKAIVFGLETLQTYQANRIFLGLLEGAFNPQRARYESWHTVVRSLLPW